MPIKRTYVVETAKSNGDWFHSMSKEQQEGYLEDHPDSQYAKEAKKSDEHDGATTNSKDKTTESKEAPKSSTEHLVKDAKNLSPEDKKFFTDGSTEPGSPSRKSVARHVKAKSKGIVAHLKATSKEWHTGCKAIHKLIKKTPLTEHDKTALKNVSKDLLAAVGSVVVTGGLASGLVLAMSHMSLDIVKDAVLKSFATGLVESKLLLLSANDKQEAAYEKMMIKLVEQLAKFIEEGDIPQPVWKKAVERLEKSKPGAKSDKKPVKSAVVTAILARLSSDAKP